MPIRRDNRESVRHVSGKRKWVAQVHGSRVVEYVRATRTRNEIKNIKIVRNQKRNDRDPWTTPRGVLDAIFEKTSGMRAVAMESGDKRDVRRYLTKVGQLITRGIKQRFRSGEGIRRAAASARGGKTLIRTGELMTAVSHKVLLGKASA